MWIEDKTKKPFTSYQDYRLAMVDQLQMPWLAPAVEPGVREYSSRESLVVDQDRADQLRATGNQVVALQGAAALVELIRRAFNNH